MSLKKQEIEQNTYIVLSYAFWRRFLSEFDYPDKIVTENEGNVRVEVSLFRVLCLSEAI